MIGKQYIIDHYVYHLTQKAQETRYRVYVTDCLKAMAGNLASSFGGTTITTRYADLIAPAPRKEEKRTAEEIILQVTGAIKKTAG